MAAIFELPFPRCSCIIISGLTRCRQPAKDRIGANRDHSMKNTKDLPDAEGRAGEKMYNNFIDQFVHIHFYEIVPLWPVLLLLGGLFFSVGIDSYIGRKLKQTLLVLLGLVFCLVLQDYVDYFMYQNKGSILLHRIVISFGFIIRPMIVILFIYIVHPGRHLLEGCLIGVNMVLYAASVFWPICYTLDQNHAYYQGIPAFRHTCAVISLILLAFLFYWTIRKFHPAERKESWIPIFVTITIPIGLVLDDNVGLLPQPVSFTTIAAVIGCSLYYNWLHLQYVREHEQALQAEQRIQIMVQQIQPHFLYNTLSTIQALCDTNPALASETTGKFAKYLRQNIDSLNQSRRIPFEKEMEHTCIYADIEMIRFPNIRIEEDIRDRDFTLPALTVQPLVENAIRHGIRICEHGEVRIASCRTEDGHEITIRDNGKGFDPEKIGETDGTHIGIRNVRERIEKICGGSLHIESRIGEGTTVTIFIPAEGGCSRS